MRRWGRGVSGCFGSDRRRREERGVVILPQLCGRAPGVPQSRLLFGLSRQAGGGGRGSAVHDSAVTFVPSDIVQPAPATHYLHDELPLLQTQWRHSLCHMLWARGYEYKWHNKSATLQSMRGVNVALALFVWDWCVMVRIDD